MEQECTFKIPSKAILLKTVQEMPTKFEYCWTELSVALTNKAIPRSNKKNSLEHFLHIGKPQRNVNFTAKGPGVSRAKNVLISLLQQGYRGRINLNALYKWYEEYPDPIQYVYIDLLIEGNTLRLSRDSKFIHTLDEAFKKILSLYPKKKPVR